MASKKKATSATKAQPPKPPRTTSEVATRLRDYFQGRADTLTAAQRSAQIHAHCGDRGESNEGTLEAFIRDHLPGRCRIARGGFIFGREEIETSDGVEITNRILESKQLDLIITNDLTLQFNAQEKTFNSIEGAYGVVSVKTNLDRKQIREALENIASIPEMPRLTINLNKDLPNYRKGHFYDLPYSAVFSYSGIQCSTLVSHVDEFYREPSHAKIDYGRRPNLIIVNNSYALIRADEARYYGRQCDTESGYDLMKGKHIGGKALFYLMCGVQWAANYGPHMSFTLSHYAGSIDWHEE